MSRRRLESCQPPPPLPRTPRRRRRPRRAAGPSSCEPSMSRNRFWGSGKGAGPGRGRKALLHEEGRGERRVKRVLHHLKASAVYLFLEVPPEPTGSMKLSQTDFALVMLRFQSCVDRSLILFIFSCSKKWYSIVTIGRSDHKYKLFVTQNMSLALYIRQ